MINGLKSEPDVLLRLKQIKDLEKETYRLFREIKREAAYNARQQYISSDIARYVGSDTSQVIYWSDCHRKAWGLPSAPRLRRQDLSAYMDLSG